MCICRGLIGSDVLHHLVRWLADACEQRADEYWVEAHWPVRTYWHKRCIPITSVEWMKCVWLLRSITKSWFITSFALVLGFILTFINVICSPHQLLCCVCFRIWLAAPPLTFPWEQRGAKEALHGENAESFLTYSKRKTSPLHEHWKSEVVNTSHLEFPPMKRTIRTKSLIKTFGFLWAQICTERFANYAFSWCSAICQVVVATGVAGRGRVRFSCVLIDMKPLIYRVREKTFSQTTTSNSILSGSETVKLHFCFFCFPSCLVILVESGAQKWGEGCYHSIRWVWW